MPARRIKDADNVSLGTDIARPRRYGFRMDCRTANYISEVSLHLALAEKRIYEQRQIIARLHAIEADATDAEEFLENLVAIRSSRIHRLNYLRR